MITRDGFSKDPTIIPEGIVVTFGQNMMEEKGGMLSFLRWFEACVADENGLWLHKCKNKPKYENLNHVYIIVARRLYGRCLYGGYAKGNTKGHLKEGGGEVGNNTMATYNVGRAIRESAIQKRANRISRISLLNKTFLIMKIMIPLAIVIGAIIVGGAIIISCRKKPEEDEQPGGLLLELSDEPDKDSVFPNQKIKGESLMLQMRTTSKPVKGQISAKDRKGFDAKVDEGSVSFQSSDESVFTVEEDPHDETKFTITPVGPGVAQLNFEADADLGEGEKTLTGFAGIEVLPGEATGFGVVFSAVEEDVVSTDTTTTATDSENTTTQAESSGEGTTTQAENADTTTVAEDTTQTTTVAEETGGFGAARRGGR